MSRLTALLALLLAAACSFPQPIITVTGEAPIELVVRVAGEGLVLLTGRVNGVHDVDFILDTGAPVTVLIDNARTRPLGLDTTGARRLGGDDPASPMGVIKGGHSISFGRVAMTDLTVVVIPGSSLPCPERFDAIGFGGVVGADLFRRFVVEIDGPRRVVRLHEPASWTPPPGLRAVPIVFESGHPYVQSTIQLPDGRRVPVRLHLDTGMSFGLSLATGNGTPFEAPAEGRSRSACFVSAKKEAIEGPLVAVELGAVQFTGVIPVYAPAAGASSTRQGGALGAEVLSRHPLVVDYPRQRIYIGGA